MLHIFGVPSILGLKSRKNNHSPKAFGEKAHLNSVFEFRKLNNCVPSSIGDLTGIDFFFIFSKFFFCSKHSFVLYFLSVIILTIFVCLFVFTWWVAVLVGKEVSCHSSKKGRL